MVSTTFNVNKDKRTVVCMITAINDIPRRLEKYGLADEEYDDVEYEICTYKGVAKCSLEDEWDEAYGKRLAEYRAAKARQVDVNTRLKDYIKGITKCVDNLYDYGLMKEPHKPEGK